MATVLIASSGFVLPGNWSVALAAFGGNLATEQQTGSVVSSPLLLLCMYCSLVIVSSLTGGLLPTLVRFTHTRMQILVSLIGGLMLGVGLFHQLPHAVAVMPGAGQDSLRGLDACMLWLMGGLLLTFFMLRIFHFHSHDTAETPAGHDHDCAHDHDHDAAHDHHHDHEAAHDHGAGHRDSGAQAGWVGILLGLSIHTVLDGVALAAHVEADALHQQPSSGLALLGFGTFLGVVLHKPLDSLTITSLMVKSGCSAKQINRVNLIYSLICPLGAALFYLGTVGGGPWRDQIVAAALAMSAGVFICISLSDLLPEVQFHSHDRVRLSLALTFGVAAAWAIGFLEPAHKHNHSAHAAVLGMPDPRNRLD